MKYLLLIITLFASNVNSDELVALVGLQHLSSPTHGEPFNHKEETSVDFAYVGLRYSVESWNFELDVTHAIDEGNDLKGANPRTIFKVEREFSIFKR